MDSTPERGPMKRFSFPRLARGGTSDPRGEAQREKAIRAAARDADGEGGR